MIEAMEKKRREMKEEFLSLTPLQRIERMSAVFNDIIALKAETLGIPEYEVYKRYLNTRKPVGR